MVTVVRLPGAVVPVLAGERTEVASVVLVRTSPELRVGTVVVTVIQVVLRVALLELPYILISKT